MATQQELAQQISAFTTQLGKVNDEIQAKIGDLETAITNASTSVGGGADGTVMEVSPELQAAVDSLKAAVQKLDDIVPDGSAAPDSDVPATGDTNPSPEPAPATDVPADGTTAPADTTTPADTTATDGSGVTSGDVASPADQPGAPA